MKMLRLPEAHRRDRAVTDEVYRMEARRSFRREGGWGAIRSDVTPYIRESSSQDCRAALFCWYASTRSNAP